MPITLDQFPVDKSYRLWDKYPVLGIDTEYDNQKRAFIATTADENLECKVYRLEVPKDYRRFKRICENPKIIKVFHQCSADKNALLNIGIDLVPPYEDTMIMASQLVETFAKVGLKKLAELFLDIEPKTQKTLKAEINRLKRIAKKEKREFDWREIPEDIILPYAKDDPLYTIMLFYLWKDPIREYWSTYQFEKQLIPIIVQMQQNGFYIGRKHVRKYVNLYQKNMEKSLRRQKSILRHRHVDHEEYKPTSPRKLASSLLELGAPLLKETKTGFSTNAGVMQELSVASRIISDNGERRFLVPPIVNRFAKHVLDYRFFKKHHGTYYSPLLNRYTSKDNRFAHFDFYQSGTKTGRFSAELLQTFPRPEESRRVGHLHTVRNCVVVPPGEVIICIDMDQVEMRLFAHYANAKQLIRGFELGHDPYVVIAQDLFGKELMGEKGTDIFKALRWVGKKIALGIIYGMGKKKMIWTLVFELPNMTTQDVIKKIGMTEYKAGEVLQTFHEKYPVRDHTNELIRQLRKTGELNLSIQSDLMDINRAYRVPENLAYKVTNIEIQGTAAYVLKSAIRRCHHRIQKPFYTKRNTRMIGTVHDELIFYSKLDDKLETITRKLIAEIEDTRTFRVPLTASAKLSTKSWGDVKEWDGKQDIHQLLAA